MASDPPRVHTKDTGDMDGGFAEYLKTSAVNLCKVPANVPLERVCILLGYRGHLLPFDAVGILDQCQVLCYHPHISLSP